MIENAQAITVANVFSNAMSRRDLETISELYADDIIIWHNTTNDTQDKNENLNLLSRIFDVVSEIGYHDIICQPTPEGFVQHHVVKARFHEGDPVGECFACLMMTVRDGKIIQINEWIDGSQFGRLWDRLGQGTLASRPAPQVPPALAGALTNEEEC